MSVRSENEMKWKKIDQSLFIDAEMACEGISSLIKTAKCIWNWNSFLSLPKCSLPTNDDKKVHIEFSVAVEKKRNRNHGLWHLRIAIKFNN